MLGIRARLAITRLLGAGTLLLVVMSASRWMIAGPAIVGELLFAAGVALAVVGFLGRLWALCYIGGRKKRVLVTAGPYSQCRHPLYLFSLVGGLGLGLCTGRLSIAAIALAAGILFCPGAMRREDRFLAERFESYREYQRRVPALLPNWPLKFRDDDVEVDGRALRRALLDSAGFLVAPPLLGLLAGLQAAELLPYLFLLP